MTAAIDLSPPVFAGIAAAVYAAYWALDRLAKQDRHAEAIRQERYRRHIARLDEKEEW